MRPKCGKQVIHVVKFSVLAMGMSVFLVCGSLGFGQEQDVALTYTDEIVVQGEAVLDTATVLVVTAREMAQRGARTVAEALEMVPGGFVRVGSKGEAYLRLRGFRQQEIAVLLDGVPVASPYDGAFDLANVPVDMIDRIEVVKGAASVLYGANAMGGVVNIITRKPDGDRSLRAQTGLGTGRVLDFDVSTQGTWRGMRFLVGGSFADRDAFPLPDDYAPQAHQGKGDRENSDHRTASGLVSLGWNTGASTRLGCNFRLVDVSKGIPHHESDPRARYWRFDDWRSSEVNVTLEREEERSRLKVKLYATNLYNVLDSYDDRSYSTQQSARAFTSTLDDDAVGGDAFLRFRSGASHLVKWGMKVRHEVHRQQSDEGASWDHASAESVSIPLEGEWVPNDNLTVTYGAAFDGLFFDHPQDGGTQRLTSFNPQVATWIAPSQTWAFRVAWTRKTRFPTLRELYDVISGNADLRPMTSQSVEFGARFSPGQGIRVMGTAFYSDVDDLIDRAGRNDPFLNIDRARFKGFETTMRWSHQPQLEVFFAHTYLRARDLSSDIPKYVAYRPEHKLDLGIAIELPEAFGLNIDGSYVSDQEYVEDEQTQTLDAYTLIAVKLNWRINEKLDLSVQARNVLDARYAEEDGFPLAGRTVEATARWGF